jgi:hypothetical protein
VPGTGTGQTVPCRSRAVFKRAVFVPAQRASITVALLLGGVMPTEVLLRMAGDLHLRPGGDEFP